MLMGQSFLGISPLLATLLHQGAEGWLEDIALVEVGSVVARVYTLHA
jgi:hypothetical protein